MMDYLISQNGGMVFAVLAMATATIFQGSVQLKVLE